MSIIPMLVGQASRILPYFLTPSKSLPAQSSQVARSSGRNSGPRRLVLVDTDMSHDDMMAILYLLQHPAIDVIGITVVEGVAHVHDGVENIRRLLAMVEREDIPVAGGPGKPLAGHHAFPETWCRATASGLRLRFAPTSAAESMPAPDLIRQLISTSNRPVQIIALGPMTNIALALQDDSSLVDRLDSIVVSGGALNALDGLRESSGSPNKISEWNIWIDPLAADIVFQAGVKLIVVPLDVTDPGPDSLLISRRMARHLAQQLSATAQWREAKFVSRLLKIMFWENRSESIPVWDIAVVALAVEPALGTDWRDLHLRVITNNSTLDGQTVVDSSGGQPNARVCFAGDQAAFEQAFLNIFTPVDFR